MLNELLAEKVIVNNPTSCGDSYFIAENCLAEKEKDLREHTIKPVDILNPQKPNNNLYLRENIAIDKKKH